jgi:hypothetical protein
MTTHNLMLTKHLCIDTKQELYLASERRGTQDS